MAALHMMEPADGEYELPPRKKPKVSELPLSSAQRASIDGMLHSFKKRGEFDALRKKTFQQYNESAARGIFENALRNFTATEIEREAIKYLKPDRRLAAPLIEGAAARAQVYEKVEEDIDRYIEQYVSSAERALRDIRAKEIGAEQALAEQERGQKSDEAYAQEAEDRRVTRAKKFAEEEKLRKKKEAQERKRKEIDALKKKQEELMRETERLQREQKRRLERDEWKKLEKERERERIRKFNEERDKAKAEAEEREKAAQAERERAEKEAKEREAKRLEQEALDRVLRAGREREELGRRPSIDRGGSMEPRSRYGLSSSRRDALPPRRDDRGYNDNRRRSRSRSRSPPRREDDDRRPREHYREGTARKESYYRDLSAEREAWKAKSRRGDDGEVNGGHSRPRSRSREHRARSRSPPRRRSPPRARERSRSPANIDRYVPGKAPPRRASRERSRDRVRRERSRDRRDFSRDRRDRSRDRRDRSREHHRDRHEDDRRRTEERPRAADIDRYVPGESRRRDRSRSRDRRRDRSREAIRDADKKDRK